MTREEAINTVRNIYQTDKEKEALGILIPELVESEDERIRKVIVKHFEELHEQSWINLEIPDILAWLEKHKDLDKMIVVSPEVWDKAIADAYENGKKDNEKQKEQKSNMLQNAFDKSKKGYTLEEKSKASDYAESILPTSIMYGESEEEYKLHTIIEAAFIAGQKEQKPIISDDAIREGVAHFGITQYQINNWLKKYINVIEQKPEWGEEDEKMLKWIEDILLIADDDLSDKLNGKVRPITDSAYSSMKLCIAKCRSWLKSLRPQYHGDVTMTEAFKMGLEAGKASSWQPSEEDLMMLEHIIGQYEIGNKNSKVMGYLPRIEELDFLKKVLAKWKN